MRLLDLAALVCFALALAVAGLDVAGRWFPVELARTKATTKPIGPRQAIILAGGELKIEAYGDDLAPWGPWRLRSLGIARPFDERWRLARRGMPPAYRPVGSYRVTTVVLWPIPVVLTVIPLLVLWLARRRRRPLPDHCRQCGYDLYGSRESCPECGTWTGRTAAADKRRRIISG